MIRCVVRGMAAGVLCWLCAAACAAQPAIADFFRRPAFTGPVLSPSGKYLAATMAGGPKNRQRLVMVDLQDLAKSKVIAAFDDADIRSAEWVNDERLVFKATDNQSPYGSQYGEGLFAIDRDGSTPVRRLIKRRYDFVTGASAIADRELSVFHRLYGVLRDGSDDVVVAEALRDSANEVTGMALSRLDTRTGVKRSVTLGAPANVMGWALDVEGRPRVAVSFSQGRSRLYWKATPDAGWTLVREYDAYSDARGGGIDPLLVDANDVLYYAARPDAKTDTEVLMRLDLRSRDAVPQQVLALDGYDYSGQLVEDRQGRLLGVHYLTDARATHWFDAKLAALQKKIDALLPATNNRIDCGVCDGTGTVLVATSSDRQPPVYYLYDTAQAELETLASSRPWIDPKAMAPQDMVRVTARDGLVFPVHVTRPRGTAAPAPMVVLVHGGPYVRGGEWRWEPQAQFLASRGYVVVEPEYRGSTGFGWRLFRAGWKQWGLAMQDDIADAAKYAIEQGWADPKRVCIAGASYGGYAALMGLVRDPGLYRCGVEWVGVTDIDLMYSITWSDFGEAWKAYGMPRLVADREKDAAQIAATSPLKLADRIRQPLLMAYGGEDRRVPIDHGTKLRERLKGVNPDVEWIVYPDEGHGWMLEANDVDFWTRVERFLGRNSGPGH